MSIRPRKWTTPKGEQRSAWIVDYKDQSGRRHQQAFDTKREATAFASKTHVEVMGGVHVADADTITIAEAADQWLKGCKRDGLEPMTVAQYGQHVRLHIVPSIGSRKLTEISVPVVRAFLDRLRDEGRSDAMLRAVRVSLGSILSDAQERGLVARNAVKEMARERPGRGSTQARHKAPPQIGVDIPTTEEVKRILAAATGWRRVFMMTAALTGMRSSELRGLRWTDVDLNKSEITVRQRADAKRTIGSPKSKAGRRTIPIGPALVQALRDWRPDCPKGDAGLVFPNGDGKPEYHVNLIERTLKPILLKAGLVVDSGKVDAVGAPIMCAKYTGLHCLRHYYASMLINRRADGGLETTPKVVQARMGHSSIQVTLDTYSHLWPSAEASEEMARAEALLL